MPDPSLNDPAAIGTDPTAWRHAPAHALFWCVAVGLLALDLWSKAAVFASLAADQAVSVLGGVFEFRRSLNDGAVFGSFTGQTGLFIGASFLALAFVVYLFVHSGARHRFMHIALGMILAGALGNLYDRAFMKADVVRIPNHTGRIVSHIGKIVSGPGDPEIRVGDWPDGGNPRQFPVSKVEVRRQGVVRDFIKFVPKFPEGFPKLGGRDVWPWVFNVADVSLVTGVILLLLQTSLDREPRNRAA